MRYGRMLMKTGEREKCGMKVSSSIRHYYHISSAEVKVREAKTQEDRSHVGIRT
jgi:hypothetical protein